MTMTIDFTQLSEPISNALDSDYIDIYRQINETPERDLYASNVKCHIAIKTTDNPNPESVDVQPIITSLRIHCPNWVDLKNNDYIIAKKCDLLGNVLHYYSGIIGEPAVSMARQSVNMIMSSLNEGDEPIPPPPPIDESVSVFVNYLDELGEPIRETTEQQYKKGSNVVINSLSLENYALTKIELNGEIVQIAQIDDIQENAIVDFYYQSVITITNIRPLVYGDYIKDDGTYAYGLHLYAPINVLSINGNTLKLASNKFYHEEIGEIKIVKDDKFKDNLGNWHIVTLNPEKVNDGYIISFADTEPVENAYVTHWYEV